MTTDTAIQRGEWVQRARALAPIVAQWRVVVMDCQSRAQEKHAPHDAPQAPARICLGPAIASVTFED